MTLRVLDGTEEFHLVAGVVRDGGGNVTNHGNSRRSNTAAFAAYVGAVAGGISQAFADGRYLRIGNNLSDLGSAVTARGNLSVYSIAQVDALLATAGAPNLEATITKPVVANFTVDNAVAGLTATDVANGIQFKDTNNSATIRFLRSNTAPGAANFVATFRLKRNLANLGGAYAAAIIVRNSTNGRVTIWGDYQANNWLIQDWVNYAGFSGTELAPIATEPASFPWRRVTRAGDVLTFEASPDGIAWGLVKVTSVVSFLTASGGGNIDQVGIGVYSSGGSASNPVTTILHSFTLT